VAGLGNGETFNKMMAVVYRACGRVARVLGLGISEGVTVMFIVHVFVHVKHEFIDAFKEATLENARNSIQEPGIARFDVIRQLDDETRFVLVEVYRTPDDPARHKETAHYAKWRDTVAEMMAEPRSSVKYDNVFPVDEGWG
jgi:quinol monooxygenase YgiN